MPSRPLDSSRLITSLSRFCLPNLAAPIAASLHLLTLHTGPHPVECFARDLNVKPDESSSCAEIPLNCLELRLSRTLAVLSSRPLFCLVRPFSGSCWASGCLSQLLNNRFKVEIACLGNLTRVASGAAGLCMSRDEKVVWFGLNWGFWHWLQENRKNRAGVWNSTTAALWRNKLWAASVFLCGESGVVSAKSKKKKKGLESETVFATRSRGS